MEKVIKVNNLKKYFGDVKAIDGISFDVNRGEIFGFLGPNGAGKTTTIRCMMDFIRPDIGSIELLGMDAQKASEKLKKDIGFLSGEVNLYQDWTGHEHINLVRKIRNIDKIQNDIIKSLNYDPNIIVKKLSSGNRQKLGLVLSLIFQPKIIILDEPTNSLDPLLQNSLYQVLKEQAQKGNTVFMSSHNLSEVEKICDRVCIIKKGKIVTIEGVKALKQKRLYTIRADFKDRIPGEQEFPENTKISKDEMSNTIIIKAVSSINSILEVLHQYELRDLEIKHATLEEMFIEFYR